MNYTVTAVEQDRAIGHPSISELGNTQDGWSISAKSAMIRIGLGKDRFFVMDPVSAELAEILVVRAEGQAPHLRASLNGRWTNHLLALPSAHNCRRID
jgi:hypothetical protein